MQRLTFLLLFLSVQLFAQDSDLNSWQVQDLKKFNVQINFPDTAVQTTDEFANQFAKYESNEFTDSTRNTTFKILALHHRGFYPRRSDEKFYKKFIKEWVATTEVEILNSEFLIENEERIVRGVSLLNKETKYFSAWQISKVGGNLFILSITNNTGDFDKSELLYFFESLKIQDNGEPEMYIFQNEMAAVSFEAAVNLKYSFKDQEVEEYGENRPVRMYTFIGKDKYENLNYLMVYKNTPPGIIFENIDSAFLEIKSFYEAIFKSEATQIKRFLYNGYHTMEMNYTFSRSQAYFRIIIRKNRLYLFFIERFGKVSGFEEKKNAFFNSIEFLPLKYIDLKEANISDHFMIDFPDHFIKEKETSFDFPFQMETTYTAIDSLSSLSYAISDYQLSPFFYTENYDSLIQADTDTLKKNYDYLIYSDSLFEDGPVWYLRYKYPDSNLISHQILMYRGSHYYNLMVFGDEETPNEIIWNFFRSFKIKNPEDTYDSIKKDKRKALLQALASRDSTTLSEAKFATEYVIFEKTNLPEIYHLIEQDFSDDTLSYPTVNSLMLRELEKINDENTFVFLDNLFVKNSDKPKYQKRILETFLKMKSEEGLNHFFKNADNFDKDNKSNFQYWDGFYSLNDSLTLMSDYSAELWGFMDHKSLRYYSLNILNLLYKDSLIELAQLEKHIPQLLNKGSEIIDEYNLLTEDSIVFRGELYDLEKINALISHLGPSETIDNFVNKELQILDPFLLANGIRAALKRNIPVENKYFDTVFKSKYNCYYLLRETSKENTFEFVPDTLFNQDIVVESLVYFEFENDYDTLLNYQSLQKREIVKNGEQLILHIFKATIKDYDNPLIGICQQPVDSQKIEISPAYFNYDYYDETKKSEQQFIDDLIQDFVKWEPTSD